MTDEIGDDVFYNAFRDAVMSDTVQTSSGDGWVVHSFTHPLGGTCWLAAYDGGAEEERDRLTEAFKQLGIKIVYV